MVQTDTSTLSLTGVGDAIRLSGGTIANGTYTNVKTLTITNGLITGISTGPDIRTFILDVDTFSAASLSAVNAATGTCSTIYPYNAITDTTNILKPNPDLIRTSYLNNIWNTSISLYGAAHEGDIAFILHTLSASTLDASDDLTTLSPRIWGLKYTFTNGVWVYNQALCHNRVTSTKYSNNHVLFWNHNGYHTSTSTTATRTVITPQGAVTSVTVPS